MPTNSGITLEILSQLELAIHPEFPHPESSQFTFRSPKAGHRSVVQDWTPPTPSGSSKADALLGRNTTASVYIPSVAGAQFWLRYNFNEVAQAQSKYYYFKLFMNGRHIASFGADSRKISKGHIMYGLFDPSAAWNYEHNGEVWKNNGLEKRSFFFAKANKQRSVINDGGLVEVMCFRANGRRRKLPDPEPWRDQEDYGIDTASEGLHPHPEDAKFFDWNLKDAKTSPYIVFKFHYRSWDSLRAMELIPANYVRSMMAPERKLKPEELEAMLDIQKKDPAFLCRPHSPCEDCVSTFSTVASTSTVDYDLPDNNPEKSLNDVDSEEDDESEPEISPSPLQVRRRRPTNPGKFTEMFGSPSPRGSLVLSSMQTQGILDEFMDRPLPDIPMRKSSRPRLSRSSSMKSQAPSVTPSLLSQIENPAWSPEAEIGIAKVVQLGSRGPMSPAAVPSLQSDSDLWETSDLVETPARIAHIRRSSFLPNIEEDSPVLRRDRPLSPTGFSPINRFAAIRRKPVGLATLSPQRRSITTPLDILASPNITMRKNRHTVFKRGIPKSKTVGNLSNFTSEAPEFSAQATNAILGPMLQAGPVPESQWMSRVSSLRSSSSVQQDLGDSHPPSSSHGLKNVMNNIATRSNSLTNSFKTRSSSWYRKARNGNSSGHNASNSNSSSEISDTPEFRSAIGPPLGNSTSVIGNFTGNWI